MHGTHRNPGLKEHANNKFPWINYKSTGVLRNLCQSNYLKNLKSMVYIWRTGRGNGFSKFSCCRIYIHIYIFWKPLNIIRKHMQNNYNLLQRMLGKPNLINLTIPLSLFRRSSHFNTINFFFSLKLKGAFVFFNLWLLNVEYLMLSDELILNTGFEDVVCFLF